MTPVYRAGLDVGTTKVTVVAAEIGENGVRLLGAASVPCTGLKKGIVVNVDSTAEAISLAIKEAETLSGMKIRSALVSISGPDIKSFESAGAVRVRGREVNEHDIERAVDSAKVVYIPLDRDVLNVIPTEFTLDGHTGLTDPTGMTGVRLEAKARIITGPAPQVQNLVNCCAKAGIRVAEFVFAPVASAHAALSREEKESGVLLADIGGGTTGIVFFKDGALRHTAVIGIGGNHLTNDIAVGLRLHPSEAERIKKEFGAATADFVPEGEIKIGRPGGQEEFLSRKLVSEILEPRCEELLGLIGEEIRKHVRSSLCGVVLTGGSSLLRGFDVMAGAKLGLHVRIGAAPAIGAAAVEGPAGATAVGLAAADISESVFKDSSETEPQPNRFGRFSGRMKQFFDYREFINLIIRKKGGVLCLKSRK